MSIFFVCENTTNFVLYKFIRRTYVLLRRMRGLHTNFNRTTSDNYIHVGSSKNENIL